MRLTTLSPPDRLTVYQVYPPPDVTHLGDLAIMQVRFVAERAVPENPRASMKNLDEFMKTVEKLYHKAPQVLVGGDTYEVPLAFFEQCVAAAMGWVVSLHKLPVHLRGLAVTNWVGDVLAEVRKSVGTRIDLESPELDKTIQELTIRLAVLAAIPPRHSHKYVDGVFPVFDLRPEGDKLRITIAVGTKIEELSFEEEGDTDEKALAYN